MIRKIIINAVILLLLMQGIVLAQADINIEFYGTIQSANSTAIVVNGQIVDIREAQVNVPLSAGVGVRVQATVLSDGSLLARQVDAVSVGVIPGIVEITGTITDLTLVALNIGDQSIDLTGAEVSGSLSIGQSVRVFAIATAPGVWQARFVDASDNVLVPVSTPEIDTSGLLPPVSTPEVQPPVSTPEVGDDDDSHDDNDNSHGDDDDDDDDSHGDDDGD